MGFKYWKTVGFVISVALAYEFFTQWGGSELVAHLGPYENLAALVGGMLYSFGFTSAFGAGILMSLQPENLLRAAVAGAIGGVASDVFIERFVRLSFKDELDHLKQSRAFAFLSRKFNSALSGKAREYALMAAAGFFIASPFPDEIGVAILAGLSNISEMKLVQISFAMNVIGMLALLVLGLAF